MVNRSSLQVYSTTDGKDELCTYDEALQVCRISQTYLKKARLVQLIEALQVIADQMPDIAEPVEAEKPRAFDPRGRIVTK